MDIFESNKILMTKFLKFLNSRSPVLNSSVVVRANPMGIVYRIDTMFTTEITRCYLMMWLEEKLIQYQRKITYIIGNRQEHKHYETKHELVRSFLFRLHLGDLKEYKNFIIIIPKELKANAVILNCPKKGKL